MANAVRQKQPTHGLIVVGLTFVMGLGVTERNRAYDVMCDRENCSEELTRRRREMIMLRAQKNLFHKVDLASCRVHNGHM